MEWFRRIRRQGKRLQLMRLKRLTAVGSNNRQWKQRKRGWLPTGRQHRLAQQPSTEQQRDKQLHSEKLQSDKLSSSKHNEKLQSVRQQLSVTWRSAGLPSKQLLHARPNESVALQHCSELSSSSAMS